MRDDGQIVSAFRGLPPWAYLGPQRMTQLRRR